jgi:glutathione peroxidase
MKNNKIALILFFVLISLNSFSQAETKGVIFGEQNEDGSIKKTEKTENMDFYSITVKDINDKDISMKIFRGKKLLIVNTASKCGYTPQYEELELLYKKYGGSDSNFEIIAFPCNDFGQQEPGTNKEIYTFCSEKYGVSFPVMGKISVKGETMNELYKFLTQKSKNGVLDSTVEWNFQKYLINADGNLYMMLPSGASPLCGEIMNWLDLK